MSDHESSPYLFGDDLHRDPLRWLLLRNGWIEHSEVPRKYEIWKPAGRRESSDLAVIVPLDRDRGDYMELYERAIRELNRYVGDARFAALSDELAAEDDLDLALTTWSRGSETVPGTIRWLEGQQVHMAITQQLTAAAKSAVSPARRLGRSGEYFAREFMAATLLAPSGIGSYVVNAMTPIHRTLPISAAATDNVQPLERGAIEAVAVLRRLDQALTAIEAGLSETDERAAVGMLSEQARRGVSYELVTGLVGFMAGREAAITVPRDVWVADATRKEFAFDPPHVHVLVRLADVLRGEDESTRATITGIVTKLEHEPGSTDYKVRVFTTSRGPVRRVTLHVTEQDYARCLAAHRESALVRVDGRLFKDGRLWTINEPERLDVLDADQVAEEEEAEDLFRLASDDD
ncbi:MAG: hypothetical protein JWP59_4789 [Massilia sp.]|nr:hypothetical protein [Massilia sp.]